METQVVRQTTSKENTGDTLLSKQVWEMRYTKRIPLKTKELNGL